MVNSLFEPNRCTNLDEASVLYVSKDGFTEVNAYHQRFTGCWNYLVAYTEALLEGSKPPDAPPEMPLPLRRSLKVMKGVVQVAAKAGVGNPRANLVEPQLGYCFRELEMGLQQGQGCGHGLVAIFEVVK